MKLWISSETEVSVFDELRIVTNSVEVKLGEYIADKEQNLELDSLDCIIILRKDSAFKELTWYSPNKKDRDFRLSINFVTSDFTKRKALILEMLKRAIDILGTKNTINKDALQNLKDDVVSFSEDHNLLPIQQDVKCLRCKLTSLFAL